jgi:hypothetical protein
VAIRGFTAAAVIAAAAVATGDIIFRSFDEAQLNTLCH